MMGLPFGHAATFMWTSEGPKSLKGLMLQPPLYMIGGIHCPCFGLLSTIHMRPKGIVSCS